MNEKIYYLHTYRKNANHAGEKAPKDCETIMKKLGYNELLYRVVRSNNKAIAKVQKAISEVSLFRIPKKSVLIVEHPVYMKRNYISVLKRLKKIRKVKLVFIVHDLESIRKVLPDSDIYAARDYQMYEIADSIIVHNAVMKNYLVEECSVSEEKVVELNVFDYLAEENQHLAHKNERIVAIAGNLTAEKSGYIYSLINKNLQSVSFNLYGANFDEQLCTGSNYSYKGIYDADVLPNQLEGAYGLVWDGKCIDSCRGNTGNYLRYNNPHKVSLYIAARMPIIIWKEAALARFVIDNNIGIAIDSLDDLEDAIRSVDEGKYEEFICNLNCLSQKVLSGKFLQGALQGALQKVVR